MKRAPVTGWTWGRNTMDWWAAETGRELGLVHAIRDDGEHLGGYIACTLLGSFLDTVYLCDTGDRPTEGARFCPPCMEAVRAHPHAMDMPVPPRP